MAGVKRQIDIPSWESGTIFGPQSSPKQDVYSESATQNFALGTRYVEGNRTFRYALNGAVALSKALMTQSEVGDTGSVLNVQTGHTWSVGDTSGTILIDTGGGYAKNEHAGGLLYANKVAAVGDIYQIIASELQSTDTIYNIELDTPIRTALSATTEVSVQSNRFSKTVVFAVTTTGYATGVPLIDVTADYYYWAQVGGVAPILTDGSETNVIGDPTGPPATYATAGSCGVYVTLNQMWGHIIRVGGGDNEPALVNLNIDN